MQRLVHRELRAVPSLSHCQTEGGLCLLGFPFHLLGQDSRTADSVVFSPGRALESPVELQKQISVRATPPDPVNHNWGFSPGCRCCESFPGASQGQTRLSVSRLSGNFYDSL